MTLILRKCWSDGISRNGFKYGQVGDRVTAPDWNPIPKCGNGLHGLKEGNGDWDLLQGDDYLIIEANDDDIIDIDDEKCKFRTGKILFRGSEEELSNSELPSKLKLNSKYAYLWTHFIGNKDVMIHKITDSKYAYLWARCIGNKDVMMHKITDSSWAYQWALKFGNRDVMINKIIDSQYAYYWACEFGDVNMMKSKVTDPFWITQWNVYFPSNPIQV